MKLHRHDGAEFLFVLSGKLGLRIGDQEHLLGSAGSIYFDSTESHGYRRVGKALSGDRDHGAVTA